MAQARATLLLKLKDLASRGLKTFGARLDKLSKKMDRSKIVFAAVGAGIAAAGLFALKAAGQFEQWRISFTTMLGSADRADILLNKIKKFAAETPFDLPQVVKGGRALLAFGVAAKDIIPTMKSLGDVSAGLGVPMERLILNFGQVKAQAKLTGRELRDFAVAGVPLLAVLAKNLAVTEAEIQKMVSAGKIGFPEVEKAFKSMSSEGGRFANLMVKQMDSLEGKFSNVKDVTFQVAVAFGDILLPAAKKLAEQLIKIGDKLLDINEGTKKTIVLIAATTTVIAGLTAGIGAFIAISGPLIAAFSIIFTVIAPVVAIIGILGFTVLALKDDFIILVDALSEQIEKMRKFFSIDLVNALIPFKLALDTLKEGVKAILTDEEKERLIEKFEEVAETSRFVMDGFKTAVIEGFNEMKESASDNFNKIIESLKKMLADALKIKKKDSIKTSLIENAEAVGKAAVEARLAKEIGIIRDKRDEAEKKRKELMKENFFKTMNFLTSLSASKNKELAAIGKASSIVLAIANTAAAVTVALRSAPPPFNFALAAAVGAAGAAQIATITGIQLAEGGIINPRPGGTIATLGEAGQAEAVIPLDDEGAGLGGITINVGVLVGSEDSVRELAVMIDEELFALKRNNESQAFDTVGSSI